MEVTNGATAVPVPYLVAHYNARVASSLSMLENGPTRPFQTFHDCFSVLGSWPGSANLHDNVNLVPLGVICQALANALLKDPPVQAFTLDAWTQRILGTLSKLASGVLYSQDRDTVNESFQRRWIISTSCASAIAHDIDMSFFTRLELVNTLLRSEFDEDNADFGDELNWHRENRQIFRAFVLLKSPHLSEEGSKCDIKRLPDDVLRRVRGFLVTPFLDIAQVIIDGGFLRNILSRREQALSSLRDSVSDVGFREALTECLSLFASKRPILLMHEGLRDFITEWLRESKSDLYVKEVVEAVLQSLLSSPNPVMAYMPRSLKRTLHLDDDAVKARMLMFRDVVTDTYL